MKKRKYAIIEIGSNNTKTHIYEGNHLILENNTTIEFKKHYQQNKQISSEDLEKLYAVIEKMREYTLDLHIYGCSIFRNMSTDELAKINQELERRFPLSIEVVTAEYTALGCYYGLNYKKNICIFIGGGGSIELIFVQQGKIIDKKFYDFGVVDITNQFSSLKNDIPDCTFDEVYTYVDHLIGDINQQTDLLILAGGDHLYWYNHAGYPLLENTLFQKDNQPYMITKEMSDEYDHDALITSLERIRNNSDNPLWFDGSRAMKVITNLISHKVGVKYIIPTKINMEDGLKNQLKKLNQKGVIV